MHHRTPSPNRRGATIVIVAIVLVVLFAFTAFAIDFGRAYLSQAELQTSADAAALAGAYELREGRSATGHDSASAMAIRNKVQSVDPNVISVEPGHWDDALRTFSPVGDWDMTGVNSVRARTGHEMGYTFARVMNLISIDLAKPAVAAVGYSSTTSCVMPWAMDYSLLLGQLPGAPGSTDYDLTYSDLEWLATNREVVSLLHTSDNQISPGNIGQAITWVGNSNQYKDAITRECYENSKVIGPGDIIEGAPGAGSGQTKGPMQDLCGADNNQDVFSCNWSVKVVVYDWFNGDSGANARFRTKFIGAFVVTCYSAGSGNASKIAEEILKECGLGPSQIQNPGESQIMGYFTTAVDDDAATVTFDPTPLLGPVALVQ